MPRLPNLVSGDIALYKTVLANGVKGYGTNTPPAASAGDCYIIGSAPTGAWVGSANKIAIYDGAAWGYIPTTGAIGTDQRNLVVAENGGGKTYRWFGAAWVEYAAPGSVNEVSYTYDPYPQYATRDELTTGGGSGDMILANAQTNSGAKTFLGRNPASAECRQHVFKPLHQREHRCAGVHAQGRRRHNCLYVRYSGV
jgi:hypothetical protein